MAMPTSSEVTLLVAERMSCRVVASIFVAAFRLAPELVDAGEILLEGELTVARDHHGVDLGVGEFQPLLGWRTAARRRGRRCRARRCVQPSSSVAGMPQAGLVWPVRRRAIAPARAARRDARAEALQCRLAPRRMSLTFLLRRRRHRDLHRRPLQHLLWNSSSFG